MIHFTFSIQDGSVYAIMSGVPLMEFPCEEEVVFNALLNCNRFISKYFNVELFTIQHAFALLTFTFVMVVFGMSLLFSRLM